MYKTKDELKMMKIEDIADYVRSLERDDETSKNNGVEFVEWCGDVLADALDDLGISIEDFTKAINTV